MLLESICFIVLGIAGMYCYDVPVDYSPPGTCVFNICFVASDKLPVRASWYDWKLGGINCQEPCDKLGNGLPAAENYDIAIACPPGWYGTVIYFPAIDSERICYDSGGEVIPTCREIFIPEKGRVFTCYIVVDFLAREQPPWAYMLLKWEPVVQYSEKEGKNDSSNRVRKWPDYYRTGQ